MIENENHIRVRQEDGKVEKKRRSNKLTKCCYCQRKRDCLLGNLP